MKTPKSTKSKTQWHELLGTLLKDLLSPVNIQVETEAKVMKESPRIDILLLRRNESEWTDEQLALLPDGIRNTKATDLLLEFKYTESFNDDALQQALGYDFFYKQFQNLKSDKLQSFLLIAKKPQNSMLKKLGYKNTEYPGVYRSSFRLFKKIILLSLNELSDEPHNAFIKCFASHRQEKEKAFQVLEKYAYNSLTTHLKSYLNGLKGIWFTLPKGEDMNLDLTPELITAWGEKWGKSYLAHLKPEEILSNFKPEEILSHFKPEERLIGLKPEERLAGLKPEERLIGLKPEERLIGLKPEERLIGLKPEELDALKSYLKKCQ